MSMEPAKGEPTNSADQIEVGAADDGLRLWRAQQAVRHGELRIAEQTANLIAMEGRATSILGWAVGIGTVAAGASANGTYRAAAGIAALMMFLCAAIVAWALRPRLWGLAGLSPSRLLDGQEQSELEIQEQVATDYEATIALNDGKLLSFGSLLAVAWVIFIAAPLIAFAIALIPVFTQSLT